MHAPHPRLIAIAGLALAIATSPAAAQLAPLDRADGGTGGPAASVGDGASRPVPLALPPEGHGIPLPLAIIPTGRATLGDAGVGWTLAPATVTVNPGYAHRRPRFGPSWTLAPSAVGAVTVELGGATLVMVPVDSAGNYRTVVDGQTLLLHRASDGWDLYDGLGHTYHFVAFTFPVGDPRHELEDPTRWYLESVSASTGQQVRLAYAIDRRELAPTLAVLEVRLTSMSYDTTPGVLCAKHEVRVEWGQPLAPDSTAPLAAEVEAGVLRVRTQVVTGLAVRAEGASCGTSAELAHYDLRYMADRDTALPRLVKVDRRGRAGTPEGGRLLPVARYWYGSATMMTPTRVRALVFGTGATRTVPAAAGSEKPRLGLANSVDTTGSMMDLDGDGLPDLVTGSTWWRNVRGGGFANPTANGRPLGTTLTTTARDTSTTSVQYGTRATDSATRTTSREETFVQVIDFNGDGRLDVLRADTAPARWILSLNEPVVAGSGGVQWRDVVLELGGIAAQLNAGGHTGIVDRLPLARSTTGQDVDTYRCKIVTDSYTDAFDVFHPATERACPPSLSTGEPTPMLADVVGSQTTRVDWHLADVNGDGYPDLVATREASANTAIAPACADPAASLFFSDHLPALSGREHYAARCTSSARFSFIRYDAATSNYLAVPTTDLQVFYNRVGAALGTTVTPFAPAVAVAPATRCGVEEWRSRVHAVSPDPVDIDHGVLYFGWLGADGAGQSCGLLDLNGDGLADRLEPDRVALGTASGFAGNFAATSPLGDGAGGYVTVARSYRSDRWAACEDDLDSPGTTPFTTYHDAGYLDVSGDGLLDYVEGSSVRLGTGVGLGPRTALLALPDDFALSRVTGTCTGASTTTAGLYDLDGDGRPEYVVHDLAAGTLATWTLANLTAGLGALDVGRLIERSDGNGTVEHLRYGNAKADTRTPHELPAAEVVLASIWTTGRDQGVVSEPTRFAYGGARIWFDALGDRWRFPGYSRVVTTRGTATAPGSEGAAVLGTATVVDGYQAGELATTAERNSLLGRPRRSYTLAGAVPADPAVWLDPAKDFAADPRWVGQRDLIYGLVPQTTAGFSALSDCVEAAQPYGPSLLLVNDGGDYDRRCRQTVAVYDKDVRDKQGSRGAPTSAYVERRSRVLGADVYGRPTLVQDDGDTHRTDDDNCKALTWAVHDGNYVLTAPARLRTLAPLNPDGVPTCTGASVILAGARWRYDGAAEGFVTRGQPTALIQERYDVARSLKLEEYTAATWTYGTAGAVLTASTDTGGKQRTARPIGWDAWRLVPTAVEVTTSDAVAPQRFTYQYDPYTLAPIEERDPNGTALRHQYDGFDRPVRDSAVDGGTGAEWMLDQVSYSGEPTVSATGPFADPWSGWLGDTLAPGGRQLRVRRWHDPVAPAAVPAAPSAMPAAESWTTIELDDRGRVRRGFRDLGADYQGRRLTIADRTYDSLGRLVFAADPYLEGVTGTLYGVTTTYRPDGVPVCQIRGRGVQTTATTSAAAARYARCSSDSFASYQRSTTVVGADDLDPASTNLGASDLVVTDAMGRERVRSRSRGGTAFEKMVSSYDRLGHAVASTRAQVASAATVTGPTWAADYDSLGQVLRYRESGTAERTSTFDHGGHLTETRWVDGAVTRATRTSYDGLGRVLRTATTANGVEDLTSITTFLYDESSGEPFHRDATRAIGRLTHAHSLAQSVYLGYDGLGRRSFATWADDAGHRVEQLEQRRLDGAPLALTFGLPDDGYAAEVASYQYDSAQRPLTARWSDPENPAGVELYRALVRDPLGRIRSQRYGNGVSESFVYRDADRDELVSRTLQTAAGFATASFVFDADLRVSQRSDRQTFASARDEVTRYAYDAARRLAAARVTDAASGALRVDDRYQYDGLGNLIAQLDSIGSRSFTATPDATDADRLCRVNDAAYTATACHYTYDVAGNNLRSPIDLLTRRDLAYDGNGRVASVRATLVPFNLALSAASYRYDPFGDVAQLDLTNSGDDRHDVRFGGVAELSTWRTGSTTTTRYQRRVPLPDGGVMLKRGSGSGARWFYLHGDADGSAVVTDGAGLVTQQTVHLPFGEVRSRTGAVGAFDSWKYLWNGGDWLGDLKIEQLGARLYEPRTGRFLARDPLIGGASAGLAHPYAFAGDDPINRRDPTGLSPEGTFDDLWTSFGSVAASAFLATIYRSGGGGGGGDPNEVAADAARSASDLAKDAGTAWAIGEAGHGARSPLGLPAFGFLVYDVNAFVDDPNLESATNVFQYFGDEIVGGLASTGGVAGSAAATATGATLGALTFWQFFELGTALSPFDGGAARDDQRRRFHTEMVRRFWAPARARAALKRAWMARELVGASTLTPSTPQLCPLANRELTRLEEELDNQLFDQRLVDRAWTLDEHLHRRSNRREPGLGAVRDRIEQLLTDPKWWKNGWEVDACAGGGTMCAFIAP